MYRAAAVVHPHAFGADIKRFSESVRPAFLQEQIFDKPLVV